MKRLSTQIYNSIKLKSNSKDVNGFKFDFIDSQLDDNKNPIIKMLKKNNIDQLANYIKNGNFESFKTLYRKSNCGPDELDSNGNSLLSIGVKSSNFQIVNFLLNENANPNIEDVRLFYIIIQKFGNTPLDDALTYQNFVIADILVKKGGKENLKLKKKECFCKQIYFPISCKLDNRFFL